MPKSPNAMQLQATASYRHILNLAIPIALSMIVPQVQFLVNNIFLGRLSEQTLAVAGITGTYYLLFAVIGLGLNNGLQALISRRAGEERTGEIGQLFQQGIFVSLFISAIGILSTYFLAPVILKNSLHSQEHVNSALSFLQIRIWGLPILYIYQMRNALLISINKSRLLLWGTLVEIGANILLDYGLIFGNLGLPNLGFNGAAYASIFAELAGLLAIVFVLNKQGVDRQLQLFSQIKFRPPVTRLLLSQSLPIMLQYAISVITSNFFYILIEHHGEQSLAISNTMRNIFGIFGFITGAFGAVSNSMVSNIIGQGKQEQVFPLIKMILRLSIGAAVFVCLLLNIFPHLFLQLFSQRESFIAEGIPVVRIVSCALVLSAATAVWLNAIVGTGNSRINLFSEMAAITVFSIYSYITLEMLHLPITIGWLAEWVFWIAMLLPSYLYMRSGRWKKKVI